MHHVLASVKKGILEGLGNTASALEGHAATEIPQQTILEVEEAIAAMEGEGVRVDWISKHIGKLLKAKDHHRLARNVNQLREHVAGVQRQLDEIVDELGRLEAEM